MIERPPFDEHATAAHPAGKFGIIRILDAEANRATEGLRVIEDYVRFVLDDRHLTKLAKELRHDLAAALEPIWQHGRLAARAADADVGAMLAADLTAQARIRPRWRSPVSNGHSRRCAAWRNTPS